MFLPIPVSNMRCRTLGLALCPVEVFTGKKRILSISGQDSWEISLREPNPITSLIDKTLGNISRIAAYGWIASCHAGGPAGGAGRERQDLGETHEGSWRAQTPMHIFLLSSGQALGERRVSSSHQGS